MLLSGTTTPLSDSKAADPFTPITSSIASVKTGAATMAEQPKEPAEQSGSGADAGVGGWGDDDDSIDID